jgi:hypothetical protein
MRAGLAIAATVAAALLASGCQDATGETRHESSSIELDKADNARVEIRMGGGKLNVKGGTPKLLEANFDFNVPEWRPKVDYRSGPSGGVLTVAQSTNNHSFGNTVNTWDLKLNGQLPLDVITDMGAGEANLELGQMNLRSVSVNMGAGELKLDLRGVPKRDYNVKVNGGVGEAFVYLPKDAGISATASGGIGGISTTGLEKRDGVWINADPAHSPVTVHVDVKGGVGQINLVR